MPRLFGLVLAVFGGLACSTFAAAASAAQDRIRYDNQCFIINGKDTFLYSGSFHYFRCPKPLWAARFQKMKEAGLNCVETYVAWNWHERQPPASLDDFSKIDMTDLTDWLDMAINQFGFYVILRPGPYICAEWDGGGYPQWLVTKKPADAPKNWLRSDDPVYLDWCKHWYTAAAKAAVPFQITHRPAGQPGVILWQIENEYNYADFPATVKLHQLQALAHDSRDLGIDVPLITCMTNDPLYKTDPFLVQNVVECRNTYPGFNPRNELRDITILDRYQPEKPKMITELQGGWFSDVGNKLSSQMGFTPEQITHVTLLAWAHGYTGTNYYMMFGGTNLGDWAAAWKTTTYDYAAPIREWGGVGPRYFAVQAMANFLKNHAVQLERSSQIGGSDDAEDLTDVSTVVRQASDGSRFLFIFNNDRDDSARGTLHVATGGIKGDLNYDLAPFDAKILYLPPDQTDPAKGQWYPQPVPPPQRPTDLPADVSITGVRRQVDPGPATDSWRDLPDGASVEDAGIFDRRYVFYRSDSFGATSALTSLTTRLAGQDSFIAQLNDTRLDVQRYGRELVAANWPAQSNGDSRLLLLYENGGRANGGDDMNARCGLRDLSVGAHLALPHTLTNWKIRPENSDPAPDIAADLDDSSWSVTRVGRAYQVRPGNAAVFRTTVDLKPQELTTPHFLVFGQLAEQRRVYVNGKEVAAQTEPRFDVTSMLRAGANSVAVYVKAGRSRTGIGNGVELETGKSPDAVALHWQISGETVGAAGKWQDPALDDSKWETVKLSPAETAAASADPSGNVPVNLVWYRLRFDLPSPNPHVWVPWKLHLEATGNGFIYLNGHALGRWWEVGPQQDFYLPECWLNFGPGSTNVVALCLRPTKGSPEVRSASVSPYRDFAETR
ncbi:MAG TPA: beta-galactosidase [Tepidisphaeraceae bacterium]|jgi:hypothetical protein|nr:beta-galactosidase [Tepidisphaeraceae bacterium]